MTNNGMTNNGMTNNGMTNTMTNGMTNNGMTNNGMTNNGMTNNGMTNNGMTNTMTNGMTNNGMTNNGMANNGMVNNGMTNGVNNGMVQNFQFSTTTQRNPIFKPQANVGGVDLTNIFNQKQFKPTSGGFVQSQQGCVSSPCMNGGTCTNLNGGFQCTCRQGFLGLTCAQPDVCNPNPCGMAGTCLALESNQIGLNFVCVCQAGSLIGRGGCAQTESNPCVTMPPQDPKKPATQFGLLMDPRVFVQCEGAKPNVRFCVNNLKFSFNKQMCDF